MSGVDPYHAAGLFVIGVAVGLGIVWAVEWIRTLDRRAEARRAFHDHQAFLTALDIDGDTPVYTATCAHIAAFAAEEIDDDWADLMNTIDPEGDVA